MHLTEKKQGIKYECTLLLHLNPSYGLFQLRKKLTPHLRSRSPELYRNDNTSLSYVFGFPILVIVIQPCDLK